MGGLVSVGVRTGKLEEGGKKWKCRTVNTDYREQLLGNNVTLHESRMRCVENKFASVGFSVTRFENRKCVCVYVYVCVYVCVEGK